MDRIGTPEVVDIALIAGVLLLGALGSWRGAVKELFGSVSIPLGLLVASEWAVEWSDPVADALNVDLADAELLIRLLLLLGPPVLIGYVASVNAGLPPADGPGRLGGFIVGALNAVILFAAVGTAIYDLWLGRADRETVEETRFAHSLIFDFDLIVLAALAIALVLAFASVSVRRRRMAILAPGQHVRPGRSGYHMRRERPLAPEAEKLETGKRPAGVEPDPFGRTVPISRVSDRTAVPERPPVATGEWGAPNDASDVVRCLSCGERLSADDRFCPRCGRSLVR